MSQMDLSFGLVCRGTDTGLLMSDVDKLKEIANFGDFDDRHNNWVGTAIERNFESHVEVDVANLILWVTIGFDWRCGQPSGHSEDGQILAEFLVLQTHRNDGDNLVVWLGDPFESSESRLTANYAVHW